MIQFKRITLRSNIVYPDPQLLTTEEQSRQGISKYVPEGQIAFKCKDGLIISTTFHTILFQVNTHKTKFPVEKGRKIQRLTLSGDNVFQHIFVLDKKYYNDYGIPVMFGPPMDQMVFANSDGTYIVNTFHIIQVIP